MRLRESDIGGLRSRLRGALLRPGDASYEETRRIYNGMLSRRPALIIRALGTADIVDAIRFARAHGLEMSVRGGGHSVAGKAVCESGLMLDLSLMKGVHVDPGCRVAWAQGGVTWGELNRETQLHGLATTGGIVSTTGIAGLTLGGGFGWLMGKYGLAADNMMAAQVVTADGSILQASAEEDRELLWALRGGGGNFGVVPWFQYKLHPVGPVRSGLVAHSVERARDVFELYREQSASAPDELALQAGLLRAREDSATPLAAIVACDCGPDAEAEARLRPLKAFGSPIVDTLTTASYEDTNSDLVDPLLPWGNRYYWRSTFLADLGDAAIDALIAQFSVCPSTLSLLILEHFHGAATRIGVDETAFPYRCESHNLLIISQWLHAEDDDENISWARATYDALRPFMAGASYLNYQTDDQTTDALEHTYGPNYARLAALKDKLDPTNFFHLNQNIPPQK